MRAEGLGRLEARLLVWLGGLALLLVLVSGAVPNLPWLPDWSAADSPVRLVTDVAGEMTVWTWFNCAVLAAAALAYATGAVLRRLAGRRWWPWAVLAVVLVGLSVDDLVALHERLGPLGVAFGAGDGWLTAAWVVPGLAVAVLVVVAVALVARRLSRVPRALLLVGTATFLGAALGLELVAFGVLDAVGTGPPYVLVTSLEELLEAWGAVLVLVSGVAALRVRAADGVLRVEVR